MNQNLENINYLLNQANVITKSIRKQGFGSLKPEDIIEMQNIIAELGRHVEDEETPPKIREALRTMVRQLDSQMKFICQTLRVPWTSSGKEPYMKRPQDMSEEKLRRGTVGKTQDRPEEYPYPEGRGLSDEEREARRKRRHKERYNEEAPEQERRGKAKPDDEEYEEDKEEEEKIYKPGMNPSRFNIKTATQEEMDIHNTWVENKELDEKIAPSEDQSRPEWMLSCSKEGGSEKECARRWTQFQEEKKLESIKPHLEPEEDEELNKLIKELQTTIYPKSVASQILTSCLRKGLHPPREIWNWLEASDIEYSRRLIEQERVESGNLILKSQGKTHYGFDSSKMSWEDCHKLANLIQKGIVGNTRADNLILKRGRWFWKDKDGGYNLL